MSSRSHRGRAPYFAGGLLAGAALLALAGSAAAAPPPTAAVRAWEGAGDAATLDAWVHAHLRRSDAAVARLLAATGARTIANTLRPYDDALNELSLAIYQSSLLYGVGATRELRDKGQALTQEASAALTALNLHPQVYRALAAVPAPADAATRHYLERTLLEYRLAGVDKDDATRAKIKALQDKITEAGLAYERTVHDDLRTVVADTAQLDGLPPDYLASHPADAEGHVRITTDPPDNWPAAKFSNNADLRRKVYLSYVQRGYPANGDILRGLLSSRHELAQLLGYPTWADFAMADQMIGSPAKLAQFLQQIDAASREPGAREMRELLAFARQRDPAVTQITRADVRYWQEQYRRAKFDFDSQSVRPYFPYAAVERGVIATASKLFHVEIKPVAAEHAWHASVTTYDVFDGPRRLGRVYLDMHPREGKDKWFSSSPVTAGIAGRQLPEGALVCNFPGGSAGDPGLMQYGDVVTFLHEFGHLMHHIIGSQNAYSGEGGFLVEGDFVEAPSQMLEEFFHDYGVLTTFARHYQSGELLPQDLFERMVRADTFGRAYEQQAQLLYTAVSLDYHTLPPATLDFDAVYEKDFARFNSSAFVPGDRFWASFTHLNGYSSNYYTYVLDKVIALDFFAQFDPRNLLGGPAGMRYRQTVLAAGATRPAAQLVHDFLGREMNLDAYRRWMLAEFEDQPADGQPAAATASSSAH